MRIIKKIITIFVLLWGVIFLLNYSFPLNIDRLNKPKSTLVYDREHHLLGVKLSSDGFLRTPLNENSLSFDVKRVVLGYEDQYFEQHFGVNPLAIVRALWFNLTNQKRIGASTITMQVARMMHHKKRTFGQKLIEMFQAFQLEWNYSKEEILRFYLNNAPYGGNVEGFNSASFYYFHLPPSSLSLSQIAYLTSIPKNPNANRPKKKRDINGIKNRLLKRLFELKLLSNNDYTRAKEEQITVNIQPLPHEIPHLLAKIKQEGEVNTTIDLTLQKKIETLLKKRVKEIEKFGIHNGAILLIENHTMQILAYVGSNDFYDTKNGGQNDGITAIHSPGSTLKPLVYARALEEGLITPQKKVFDLPLFIEGYKPSNYSRTYEGEVTVSDALQHSLNIPAVELDRLLKNRSLYSLLKKVNIHSLTEKKSYYGASLTLGGFGISLKENAQLFAMLANGGRYQKATYLQEQNQTKPIQLLSASSTYLFSNILADAPRLSFSSTWESIKGKSKISFKTGTSAHAKDMLTLGYTPDYTVAVWFGNFSGKSSHPLNGHYPSGLTIASPTLFDVFNLLGEQSWFKKPTTITTKAICQDAIQLGACQHPIKDELIEGVELKNECKTMRAEVLSYLQEHHYINSISDLKEHHCFKEWKSYRPHITSPINQESYTQNQLLPKELKAIKLQCYSFEENQTIYWLIDNEAPIIAESGKPLYHYFEPKKHNISCLDEGAKKRDIEFFSEEI